MNSVSFLTVLVAACFAENYAIKSIIVSVNNQLNQVSLPYDFSVTIEALKDNATLLDTMKKAKASGKLSFSGKVYKSVGLEVTEINGYKADALRQDFWKIFGGKDMKPLTQGVTNYVPSDDENVLFSLTNFNMHNTDNVKYIKIAANYELGCVDPPYDFEIEVMGNKKDATILKVMENAAEGNRLSFNGRNYHADSEFYITEINGKMADESSWQYWQITVEENKPLFPQAVGSYVPNNGERIIFNLESWSTSTANDKGLTLAVNFKIDDTQSPYDFRIFVSGLEDGATLIKAMEKAKTISEFTYSGKEYPGLGLFVTEINGVTANAVIGEYWKILGGKNQSNLQPLEKGVSSYVPSNGEIVLFVLEVYISPEDKSVNIAHSYLPAGIGSPYGASFFVGGLKDSATLLDALKKSQSEGKLSFHGKDVQDLGFVITDINGVNANESVNELWQILGWVDMKPLEKDVSSYIPYNGETILFNLTSNHKVVSSSAKTPIFYTILAMMVYGLVI